MHETKQCQCCWETLSLWEKYKSNACWLAGGYLAEVYVCDQLFKSSQAKLKKVDAEQDAAKVAFECLQQQQQDSPSDCTRTPGDTQILLLPSSYLFPFQQIIQRTYYNK